MIWLFDEQSFALPLHDRQGRQAESYRIFDVLPLDIVYNF